MVDARITEAVEERLRSAEGIDASSVVVATEDGVVTLRGTVARAEDREAARSLARDTEGVSRVRDALQVTGDR